METVIASPALTPLIERFEAAFARAGLPQSRVRVTWNYDTTHCHLQCIAADGTGWERYSRGKLPPGPGTDPTALTLARVREMVAWMERAAGRVELGGPLTDHSCVVLLYPPTWAGSSTPPTTTAEPPTGPA